MGCGGTASGGGSLGAVGEFLAHSASALGGMGGGFAPSGHPAGLDSGSAEPEVDGLELDLGLDEFGAEVVGWAAAPWAPATSANSDTMLSDRTSLIIGCRPRSGTGAG